MSSIKSGLKASGLIVAAALSLMAFMTAAAQANWLVGGSELKANESVAIKAATAIVFTIPAKNMEIQCTTVNSLNLKLISSSTTAEGNLDYSGCATFSPIGSGKENKNCKPAEPITFGIKRLIVLHNGINYLLDEPLVGMPLTTVEFPELCALVETSEITGTQALECAHILSMVFVFLDCGIDVGGHWARPAPAALFPSDKLSFGENAMAVSGVIFEELSGANAGKSWAGHV